MASSDSSLRFRAPACAPFGFGLRRRFPSSSALRCILARPPKFLTELSRRVVLLCPAAPARPKPIRALGVGFTASELLATRNSSNETLRRRLICAESSFPVSLLFSSVTSPVRGLQAPNPKYLFALLKLMSLTIGPSHLRSFGSSPFSTSSPSFWHRSRRKYSWRV